MGEGRTGAGRAVRDRRECLEVGARDPGQPEHRQPGRKVEQRRVLADSRARRREPLGGARSTDPLAQTPPQLGLPIAAFIAALPCPDQVRALHGIAVEELGYVPYGPKPAHRVLRVTAGALEVACKRGQPRLGQALVDDLEQRPHRALRHPGICVRIDAGRGRQRTLDQPRREREVDVRAHAVAPPVARAEQGRQPLGEPALDPARGDRDDLGRERVVQRLEQRRG